MKEELYIVWDWDLGLVCVAGKEEAEKEYQKHLAANYRYFNGEELDSDDMGYKLVLAKLSKGYMLQMDGKQGAWEEIEVDYEHS